MLFKRSSESNARNSHDRLFSATNEDELLKAFDFSKHTITRCVIKKGFEIQRSLLGNVRDLGADWEKDLSKNRATFYEILEILTCYVITSFTTKATRNCIQQSPLTLPIANCIPYTSLATQSLVVLAKHMANENIKLNLSKAIKTTLRFSFEKRFSGDQIQDIFVKSSDLVDDLIATSKDNVDRVISNIWQCLAGFILSSEKEDIDSDHMIHLASGHFKLFYTDD